MKCWKLWLMIDRLVRNRERNCVDDLIGLNDRGRFLLGRAFPS